MRRDDSVPEVGKSWLCCVMHIDTIPNRKSRPAYLLRESVRDGKHVRKRTLANLSSLPLDQIEAIRRILRVRGSAPSRTGWRWCARAPTATSRP